MGHEPWEQGPSLGDSQSPTDLPILCMCSTCKYVVSTKMIQIRNVPDSLHRALKSRVALEGMSLSDYLRAEIERLALLCTPHLMDAKVLQVLRRYAARTTCFQAGSGSWILRLLPATPPMWPSPRPWMLHS